MRSRGTVSLLWKQASQTTDLKSRCTSSLVFGLFVHFHPWPGILRHWLVQHRHHWIYENHRSVDRLALEQDWGCFNTPSFSKSLEIGQWKHNFESQITVYAQIAEIVSPKLGIYLENSSSKLNFRQIHLVYLPKRGPISKPVIATDEIVPLPGVEVPKFL